ncbi:hypothetical protein KUTeg_000254 [Tegillarca granosa]|uniref:Uncharacterized protein n=1 Tax=Tegillarca granosa TaxID=220873 RepID=A0ABQ9FX09_TEGGR|nr:hypothetical protein KUTeg_000254 [Tegillarca granosa]
MATVIFLFQTYAAVGVGFVCLFIGIPLWWKTTEVYRVSLPYADITDLTQSKVGLDTKLADIILYSRDGSNEEKNYLKTVSKVEELDNIISNKDDMNTYQIVLIEKNSLSLTKPFIGSYRSVFYPFLMHLNFTTSKVVLTELVYYAVKVLDRQVLLEGLDRQTSSAGVFGQTSSAEGFGQTSSTGGFGQTSSTGGFGQKISAEGFGQTSSTEGFGQTSSTGGFGQTSSTEGFGQTSSTGGFGQTSSAEGQVLLECLDRPVLLKGLDRQDLLEGLDRKVLLKGLDRQVLLKGLDRQVLLEGCDRQVLLEGLDRQVLLEGLDRQVLLEGFDRQVLLEGLDRQVLLKDLVGEDLSRIIRDVLIKEVSLSKTFNSIKGARNISLKTADKESMRSLKYNPGYDITFTLVSPQPDIIDAQWDIEGGVKVIYSMSQIKCQLGSYPLITVRDHKSF